MNLAHEFVLRSGMGVDAARRYWDGSCIDFAGELIDDFGRGRLAYFECPHNPRWRYHAAAEIDGMIHDLWQEHPMELNVFMQRIGAEAVDYPAEEVA